MQYGFSFVILRRINWRLYIYTCTVTPGPTMRRRPTRRPYIILLLICCNTICFIFLYRLLHTCATLHWWTMAYMSQDCKLDDGDVTSLLYIVLQHNFDFASYHSTCSVVHDEFLEAWSPLRGPYILAVTLPTQNCSLLRIIKQVKWMFNRAFSHRVALLCDTCNRLLCSRYAHGNTRCTAFTGAEVGFIFWIHSFNVVGRRRCDLRIWRAATRVRVGMF